MSAKDGWMQVEWNSGGRSVVNVRYLLKSMPSGAELKVGTVVTIGKQENGDPLTATVLACARDRKLLENPPPEEPAEAPAHAGPSEQKDENLEQGDYSPSASDWEPTDESSSTSEESEEEEDNSKRVKMNRSNIRQYPSKTGKKVLTPTHRPNAVIPNGMQQLALQNLLKNRKRAIDEINNKPLPDSTKKHKQNDHNNSKQILNKLARSSHFLFKEVFKIMKEINPSFKISNITGKRNSVVADIATNKTQDNSEYVKNEMDHADQVDYSERSDDNVLISNKYDTVEQKQDVKEEDDEDDWVRIGSGTTMISKEKYRNVNWKSYTVATRTLLLAAFTRRTLATHSLTGKKSPAFTNKPAKMCLDPKIVSDIVIEITDKFGVKDNLVRSIITTKCADECKMYKMKKNKAIDKKKQEKQMNQENIPPPASSTKN